MKTIKRYASATYHTRTGHGGGYGRAAENMFFGTTSGVPYTAYMTLDLTDVSRIRSITLHLYRKDEYNARTVLLSARLKSRHTPTTWAGDNETGISMSAGAGWKTLAVTGDLLSAVKAYDGKFNLYFNSGYNVTMHGDTGAGKSPYLEVVYEDNKKSAVTADRTSAELNASVAFTMTPELASNRHTLTWSFEGASGTIAENVGTTCSWTLPEAWGRTYMTGKRTAVCTVACETFDAGGNSLGTSTIGLTVWTPADWRPSVGSAAVSETVSKVSALGCGYVQGFSKIRFRGTLTGSHGAAVTGGTWQVGSETGAISAGASYDFTTGAVNASGNVAYTITATDSRGLTGTRTGTVAVNAYAPPAVTWSVPERCRSDGTPDPAGGLNAKIMLTANAKSIGTNKCGVWIRHYDLGQWWTDYDALSSGSEHGVNIVTGGNMIGLDRSMPFEVYVYDSLTERADAVLYARRMLPTARVALHISPDGKKIGLGGLAGDEGVALNADTYFNGAWHFPDGNNDARGKLGFGNAVHEGGGTQTVDPAQSWVHIPAASAGGAGTYLICARIAYGASDRGYRTGYLTRANGSRIYGTNFTAGSCDASRDAVFFVTALQRLNDAETVTADCGETSGRGLTVTVECRMIRIL